MTIRRVARLCASCAILALAAPSIAAELIVLAPMMAGDKPVLRAGPKGEPEAPIFKRAPTDAITKSIGLETTRGATKFMLALDEEAQRIAGIKTPAPTYVLRALEDGGFARHGFWLSEANNNVVWHADHYVDLVIDKQSLEDGAFEEIFAHEMGHVLLRRLLPKLPNGLSRQPHSSLALTDYPTAFDEGFAIHFQSIARHLTQNAKLRAADKGLSFKPFLPYWQSNIDRSLRIRGVRDNLFIHRQLPALPTLGDSTPQFDLGQLKNGQQMMSSEGVVATLFYHLMLDGAEPNGALLKRYKSLLTSIRSLNSQRLTSSTPFLVSLAQTHVQRDAASKARWIGTFLNLTYGVTASSTVVRDFGNLSSLGQEGRGEEFSAALKQSRTALATLTQQITANPQRLGAALGPELWLAFKKNDKVVTLNLNTAERMALTETAGLDSTDVDLLLADRISRGPFASVDDFATRRKAPPLLRKQFDEARALAQAVGGFARE